MLDQSHFLDFLAGLLPHWFCVPCLATLSEQPKLSVREALQTVVGQHETRTAECRNCTARALTYRIHENAP